MEGDEVGGANRGLGGEGVWWRSLKIRDHLKRARSR
jgi:hypothetical protein